MQKGLRILLIGGGLMPLLFLKAAAGPVWSEEHRCRPPEAIRFSSDIKTCPYTLEQIEQWEHSEGLFDRLVDVRFYFEREPGFYDRTNHVVGFVYAKPDWWGYSFNVRYLKRNWLLAYNQKDAIIDDQGYIVAIKKGSKVLDIRGNLQDWIEFASDFLAGAEEGATSYRNAVESCSSSQSSSCWGVSTWKDALAQIEDFHRFLATVKAAEAKRRSLKLQSLLEQQAHQISVR